MAVVEVVVVVVLIFCCDVNYRGFDHGGGNCANGSGVLW